MPPLRLALRLQYERKSSVGYSIKALPWYGIRKQIKQVSINRTSCWCMHNITNRRRHLSRSYQYPVFPYYYDTRSSSRSPLSRPETSVAKIVVKHSEKKMAQIWFVFCSGKKKNDLLYPDPTTPYLGAQRHYFFASSVKRMQAWKFRKYDANAKYVMVPRTLVWTYMYY